MVIIVFYEHSPYVYPVFNFTDAAEMDAVDDFLNVMVDLSFIEDREERGRADLGFVTPKRWEAKVSSM